MNRHEFSKLFPLGSHLCREPMPEMTELKRDMENLKRHGFNLVKLQEHWMVDEPEEGRFDFSRCEELIGHAASLDVGVYLGLTCEQAPPWLWCKHPGCRMVGRNGLPIAYEAQTTLPADGKPGPCYDHPGASADQARFITKLVETLGKYENVVVWNTWQEIGYWPAGLAGQDVCYCEHTLEHFRRWLHEKYGDLDGLNRAWNTRYGDWQYVAPDRVAGGKTCLAHDVAWKYFMDNVQIAGVLKARADAIRKADPLGRPVFAHLGGPGIGSGRDWTYARCQDFLGSSCYPAWGVMQPWDDNYHTHGERYDKHLALFSEMWEKVAMQYDYVRSSNPRGAPVWAAEFQGGPVSTGFHKGRVPSADDIRRWMLTAVGSGVTAISFWVTRAEIMATEANGFSLLDSSGDTTERLEEAARVGAALGRHPELFGRPSRPAAQLGIIINEWNHQFCQSMVDGGGHLAYSVRGWYRRLWDAGIAVDFVEVMELDEDYIGDYKALILPFPISLSEATAAKLARYVEAGGELISEACPGRINEHAFCNRGELSPTAQKLFGAVHESFTMVREPDGGTRWSPRERTWGEYQDSAMLAGDGPLEGHRLRANVYIETFNCDGGEPCLRHGNAVAGTVRDAGSGRAWLLGTFAGHNGAAYRDDESRGLILALLAECDVEPEGPGRLLLRKRVSPDKEAWLFTNPTLEDVAETVDVAGWAHVEDLLGGHVEPNGDKIELTVNSLDVRVLVLER
ncbi:MAG: beta-galactosidase [Planctomycetes bacterium]|nr:beta-galactosidase [Planctomycetota bacterium]